MPQLYSYWRSSSSYRVRIVLNLNKINYEYIPVNLLKSEQLSEDYASEQNSMKQVPTFVDGDKTFTQSLAIIRYIESNLVGKGSLKPSSEALEIAEVINSGIQPVQNFSVLKKITNLGGDKMAWGKETIENGFKQIEKLLSKYSGKYCVGDEISIADVCLVPQVYNARRFGVDMKEFPLIDEIEKRLVLIEEFVEAHPDRMVDAVL